MFYYFPAEILREQGYDSAAYVCLEQAEDNTEVSWASVESLVPVREGEAELLTRADESGRAILTEESVSGVYSWETKIHEVLEQGEREVGGFPGAYIEVLLSGTGESDPVWRVRLTRVIHEDLTYDFLYASLPERFEAHLPLMEEVVDSALFPGDDGVAADVAEETKFWDISLVYPNREWINATVSEEEVFLNNYYENSTSPLHFYVKRDDTVLYTDEMLDDPEQVERLLRIYSGDVTDWRFRAMRKAVELSRQRTEIGGVPALRVTYRNEWKEGFDTDLEYLEVLLFIHNYDLYIVEGKSSLDREADLVAFIDPLLETIAVHNSIDQPPEGRLQPHSPTVQWMIDTYAVGGIFGEMDTDLWGGYLREEEHISGMREGLGRSWSIVDRKTADEAILRLRNEGDRATFQASAVESGLGMEQSEWDAMMKEFPPEAEGMRDIFEALRESFETYGDQALLAWDYCRIIQLYGEGYVAGYYTYSEALDLALPVARELQQVYSSWDEMYRDYLAGYHFHYPGDLSDPDSDNYKRVAILEELMSTRGNPGVPGSPPWDMLLVSDWHTGEAM
jgi:hypothetical protein